MGRRRALQAWSVLMVCLLMSFRTPENTVYLCSTGEVYHYNRSCRGLNNCKHEIFSVSKEEAVNKYGRRSCGWEK